MIQQSISNTQKDIPVELQQTNTHFQNPKYSQTQKILDDFFTFLHNNCNRNAKTTESA